jgi:hypothetical protein
MQILVKSVFTLFPTPITKPVQHTQSIQEDIYQISAAEDTHNHTACSTKVNDSAMCYHTHKFKLFNNIIQTFSLHF